MHYCHLYTLQCSRALLFDSFYNIFRVGRSILHLLCTAASLVKSVTFSVLEKKKLTLKLELNIFAMLLSPFIYIACMWHHCSPSWSTATKYFSRVGLYWIRSTCLVSYPSSLSCLPWSTAVSTARDDSGRYIHSLQPSKLWIAFSCFFQVASCIHSPTSVHVFCTFKI